MRTGKWHEDPNLVREMNLPVPCLDQIKAACAGGALLSRRRGGNGRGELLIESIVILVHGDGLDLIDNLVGFKRYHQVRPPRACLFIWVSKDFKRP